MLDREFESRVLGFERAWRLHGPPEIGDYLGDPFDSPSPRRGRLLVELISIDLEYRWRDAGAHGPATLAEYVERFPELVSLDRLPVELIGEEYRVRRRWGDRPPHAEFLSPFHERWEQIRAELLRVDEEAEEESVAPGYPARLPSRAPTAVRPAVADPDGPLLSDREFLLRRLIGAGRMGKVYQARWHGVGLNVAVKFLRKPFLRRPDVVRRFLDEARTIAGLRHPNIVRTRGPGRTAGGSYFLVMDLVDGPDLARLAGEGAVAEEEAIGWSMEICDALAHAHGRGIVHCDLKPANILLDQSGRIRVADFGLARSLVGDTPWTAEVEGTAPFMAPEQASRCWGPIDRRTDVYGVGAVLFALLTGRAPHVGRRLPDILADVVASTPVISPARLRPGLSGPLVDLCRTCLSKRPEARYQTVREVRSALARVRKDLPT
jgi:tRNA A-37 threonylcarbamoyl transferase component Bud32